MLRNLILPRGLRSMLQRTLWRGWRRVLLAVARPRHSYETVDAVLAWLGPLILITTLAWWLAALLTGYGLLLNAVSGLPLRSALREAGSSMFTLGFASTDRLRLTVVDFLAAATGPLVIA